MKKKKTLLQKLNEIICKARVPKYLHHMGPKTYTTRQHVKCLLLRQKLKCTYQELIGDYSQYFGIEDVPDRSTLIKFAGRVPAYLWNRVLALSAKADECEIGAIDATGISRTNASHYYLSRIDSNNPIKQHLKLSIMVDVIRRKFLSARLRSKPRHDTKDVAYLIQNSPMLPVTNLMDKGYDDNKVHAMFRNKGVFSIIPARNKDVPVSRTHGQYRKEMKRYFDYSQYWQRNLVETLISCIKRKYGSSVSSKKIRSQRSEMFCRLILHNIFSYFLKYFHYSPLMRFPNSSILRNILSN